MKLASVLEELTAHLVLLELKFALVGGIAASARGEPRFTRDVDVAVAVSGDAEAEQLLFQLGEFGYVIRALLHACPNRDEQRVQQLLALIMARGFDRKQDLLAKWAELKERFIPSRR